MKRLSITAALLLFVTCNFAQDAAKLSGNWSATFPGSSGRPGMSAGTREAKLVIAGETGTWQLNFRTNGDPCAGREYPIVISDVTSESFHFKVDAAKVLQSCPSTEIDFKMQLDGTYEGLMRDGRKVTLVRK